MRLPGQLRVLQDISSNLHEIERSSDPSELLINYRRDFLRFQIYNHPDLPRLACEFWVSLEFYKIIIVLLHKIERNSDLSELFIKYKQYLLPFKLHNPNLRGLRREFRVSSEFYKINLVLLNEEFRPLGTPH